MSRFYNRSSGKIGLPPGTMVHIGDTKTGQTTISLIDYDKDGLKETPVENIADVFPLKDEPTVTWINIDGIHDIHLMERIGQHFNIHPLTLEDIVNTGQRPKIEEFDDYLFIVCKMLTYDQEAGKVKSEQLSLVLGDTFLISFQEMAGDIFNPVRERIRKAKGRVRSMGVDYLCYTLIDAVVDHYFLILEQFGEAIETLEEVIVDKPDPDTISELHHMKREMIFLRKQIWPLRDVLGRMTKNDISQITDKTNIYLRDVHDHAIQIIDTIESMRDLLAGMLDIYLSTQSNHMNEVMKVLTIIATLFIPLSFVAGVYGMNFKFMPELDWRWGYLMFWGIIGFMVLGMFVYFRRKKWF
ncbi:MAG: magnesium/cobalt transporter CorA [Proteobacteria bacterium]|nr:magnesium/cobalt transporter CorA [Pseudomonadota bacterium]